MFCKKCGKELKEDWEICPECGTHITAPPSSSQTITTYCPKCGKTIQPDWIKCPHCKCDISKPQNVDISPSNTVSKKRVPKSIFLIIIVLFIVYQLRSCIINDAETKLSPSINESELATESSEELITPSVTVPDYLEITTEKLFRNPEKYDGIRIRLKNVLFIVMFDVYSIWDDGGSCSIEYSGPVYDEHGNEYGQLLNGDIGNIEGTFFTKDLMHTSAYIKADMIVIPSEEVETTSGSDMPQEPTDNFTPTSSSLPHPSSFCGTFAYETYYGTATITVYNDTGDIYCADLWGRGGKMNTTVTLYETANGYEGYTGSTDEAPMLTITNASEDGIQAEFTNLTDFSGWYSKQ